MSAASVAPAGAGAPGIAGDIEARVGRQDWDRLAADLDGFGNSVLEKLLTTEECRALAALYDEEAHFRSHIHMARH